MTKGFTFGNPQLFMHRKYYRAWIERTLMQSVYNAVPIISQPTVLRFKDSIDPITIEDEGRLPYGHLQRGGRVSYADDKIACLFVLIRDLIQHWWECSEENPGGIEPLLIELDHVSEAWKQEEVVGSVRMGYHLQEKI